MFFVTCVVRMMCGVLRSAFRFEVPLHDVHKRTLFYLLADCSSLSCISFTFIHSHLGIFEG